MEPANYRSRVEQAEHDAAERWELRDILVAVRERAGMTWEQVADSMGVKVKDVRDYEQGMIDPRLSFHQRYARAVGAVVTVEVGTVRHVG
jgi:ribosome-binding protein aMBF1 (putative translation factor)